MKNTKKRESSRNTKKTPFKTSFIKQALFFLITLVMVGSLLIIHLLHPPSKETTTITKVTQTGTSCTNDTNVTCLSTGRVIQLSNSETTNQTVVVSFTTVDNSCTHKFFYMSNTTNSHELPTTDYSCTGGSVTLTLNNTVSGTNNWLSQDLWINEDDVYAYQDNGYYITTNNCKGEYHDSNNNNALVLNDGSTWSIYESGIKQNIYTILQINTSYFCNDAICQHCYGKNNTNKNIIVIYQRINTTMNGGIQIDKKAWVNNSAEFNNFLINNENRAFYPNISDLFYIPTVGWKNRSSATEWYYPTDNNVFPAQIQVNLSYPFWLVYGTNDTTAKINYGGSSNIHLSVRSPNGTDYRLRNMSKTFYYYMDDLDETSKNGLNKLDFKKYVEWLSTDFYQKNFVKTDILTSFSHWTNTDSDIERTLASLNYRPEIGKDPCEQCTNIYRYINDPPESWDWLYGIVGKYSYFTPEWQAWNYTYGDESILIKNSVGNYINSSSWHYIKVNLAHENASRFWYNYNINRTEFHFIKNLTIQTWVNGSIQGYDNDSYAGNKSLIYGIDDLYSYRVAYNDEINVEPGDRLECHCMSKSLKNSVKRANVCRFQLYNSSSSSWTWENWSWAHNTIDTTWLQNNNSFPIPSDYTDITKARVLLVSGTDDAKVLIDNCNTTKNGVNWGRNLDFEETNHTTTEYYKFAHLDNFIDSKSDYSDSANGNNYKHPYEGNLWLLNFLYDEGYKIGTNQWNNELQTYKYVDFAEFESLVKSYDLAFDESRDTSIPRYLSAREIFRNSDYIKNPPVFEIFDEIFDSDNISVDNYDRTTGLLHGMAKLHNTMATYDWDDDWSSDYNANSTYIFIRAHMMDKYLPRIKSNCLWINDSNGTIPFGHNIQVNITYTPCYINTTATHYRVDGGDTINITGNNITLDGYDAESMHWIEFWSSDECRITSHDGLFFLLGENKTVTNQNYSLDIVSSTWYPYGSTTNNYGTFTYEGNCFIENEDTNTLLNTNGTFGITFTNTNAMLNLSMRSTNLLHTRGWGRNTNDIKFRHPGTTPSYNVNAWNQTRRVPVFNVTNNDDYTANLTLSINASSSNWLISCTDSYDKTGATDLTLANTEYIIAREVDPGDRVDVWCFADFLTGFNGTEDFTITEYMRKE